MLDELLRVGAVRELDDNRLELLAPAFVPRSSEPMKLGILGSDVADLITTIDHNLQHGNEDPRFQRKVMYSNYPSSALPAFRKTSAVQSQALLEKFGPMACPARPQAGRSDPDRRRNARGRGHLLLRGADGSRTQQGRLT